jgi:hypothetical protein
MRNQIGGGEISPHLFNLSHDKFLSTLPKSFKKVLFPDKTETEIDNELTKLYLENGGTITTEEDTTIAAETDGICGGDTKPTRRGNSKTKPRAASRN